MTTIKDYCTVSVADLKRLGFIRDNDVTRGELRWTSDGRLVASVGAAVNTRCVPYAKFAYTCNGEARDVVVYMRWKRSNLNPDSPNGYYYFICPVTGKTCRKLYLVNGEFMSREAFRPLYPQQVQSRAARRAALACEVEALRATRYRRKTYRGVPTPWGRKVAKLLTQYERACGVGSCSLNLGRF